jgi:hypothetical protein
VSKRHQATRRRVYGRRQHELHQRPDRRAEHGRSDVDWTGQLDVFEIDPFAFVDPRSARARYGFGD